MKDPSEENSRKGIPAINRTKAGIRARGRLFLAQGRSPMINNNRLNIDVRAKIDVFFDNVGGEILNDVLNNLNTGARIAICGAISQYNNFENILGPSAYLKLAERYSRMEGFTVMHFSEKFPEAIKELTRLYDSGDIIVPTHYEEGIESFPKSIQMLFNGGHKGKLMVKM